MNGMSDNPVDDIDYGAVPFDAADVANASSGDVLNMNTAYTVRLNRGETSSNAVTAILVQFVPGASVQSLL